MPIPDDSALPMVSTMMAGPERQMEGPNEVYASAQGCYKDMGNYVVSIGDIAGKTMPWDKGRIVKAINEKIVAKAVSSATLSFAPSWIVEKAFNKEVHNHWKNVYESLHESTAPFEANFIYSHTLFNIRADDDGGLRLKSRILVDGNLDAERNNVRENCAAPTCYW